MHTTYLKLGVERVFYKVGEVSLECSQSNSEIIVVRALAAEFLCQPEDLLDDISYERKSEATI